MSTALALSPATVAAVLHPSSSYDSLSFSASTGPVALKSFAFAPPSLSASRGRGKCSSAVSSSTTTSRTKILCGVAAKSAASVDADADPSSSPSSEAEIEAEEKAKVGARVRVSVPLKVYHVVRVPEVDLTGMEGVIKNYVAVWKGKRISANLPYKVEFVKEIEGRGPVKFVAHLKEDEFEFVDQ
ncbi:PREDICTED: ferredoxin-thioredoxin reductase, variable chain, chloroplastic [Tarenaya hassleriana]|uniref:ferredoxin-thioredoxin reductase, variable chain, chloroplastic n=1 Tax=Tarenaya hassleriana TaxID=28532 RepID=UPI00053C43BC|nr:PREDICTED: ferredoxin-thioredoxin reductase, variable chain, chloroplastic [Tarenaya hassleriana]